MALLFLELSVSTKTAPQPRLRGRLFVYRKTLRLP